MEFTEATYPHYLREYVESLAVSGGDLATTEELNVLARL